MLLVGHEQKMQQLGSLVLNFLLLELLPDREQ
jgi:hypothetical protein